MNRTRNIAFTILLIFALQFLCACNTDTSQTTGRSDATAAETTLGMHLQVEPMVPEVIVIPDTMPDDFAVYFEFWINPDQKNFLETYSGGIQKDLVLKGTQHSEFGAERRDLEAIYARMQELSIFDLSGNIISDSVQVTPNEIFLIRYRIDGHEYQVSGDGTTELLDSAEGRNLLAIMEYLRNYMINTAEYKALPAAEGGYD